mgnify:FL=1
MTEISSSPNISQGVSTRDSIAVPAEKVSSKTVSTSVAPTDNRRGEDAIQKIENETALADNAVNVTTVTISPERLSELVEQLKASMPEQAKSLRFHVDEVLDRPVVTVVDKNSGAVIRQLPSEEVIRAIHNIDYMRGILFDDFS